MASGALEQSALEEKDREQLVAIASALGVKSASRAKKQELIDMILEQTKPAAPAPKPESAKPHLASPRRQLSEQTASHSQIGRSNWQSTRERRSLRTPSVRATSSATTIAVIVSMTVVSEAMTETTVRASSATVTTETTATATGIAIDAEGADVATRARRAATATS